MVRGAKRGRNVMRYNRLPRNRVILALVTLAACAGSGTVGGACLAAGRSGASPALCSCIQRVADATLSGADQRRAATFFEDPQLAQDARQSSSPATEAFWRRYRAFSESAERSCG